MTPQQLQSLRNEGNEYEEAADEIAELTELVRWAYSKLHWTRPREMHDALMLDRMRMKLEFDL